MESRHLARPVCLSCSLGRGSAGSAQRSPVACASERLSQGTWPLFWEDFTSSSIWRGANVNGERAGEAAAPIRKQPAFPKPDRESKSLANSLIKMFYARRIPDPDKSSPSCWKLSKYIVSADSREPVHGCGGPGGPGLWVSRNRDEEALGARSLCRWALRSSCCVPGGAGARGLCGICLPPPHPPGQCPVSP